MSIRAPRVFTIPPGVPFLPTLSRALIDGELIDGFPGSSGPLALADATIYVPTQRAAAALAEALLEASGRGAVLLPRIAPLGAFEPDEAQMFIEPAAETAPRPGLPPAVGVLTRRHTLATLVRRWGQALRGAIRSADANGLEFDAREPALVAATPAQAYALAGDLATLADDMIIEGVDPKALDALDPGGAHDRYWGITLDFLKIVFAAWPEWLAEKGLIDRAARVAALVQAEVAALASDANRRGPTIIAGSTGANRATARLIAAVARAEQGAVVLPGLDRYLDDRAWAMIGARDGDEQGLAGHPQALLHRQIGLIGLTREDVRPLGALPKALAAREALVSEALRPADSTDAWRLRDAALAPAPVAEALAEVAVIVADHETEEALALAIAMREVLETPGKTAALITPDPSIARRVSAELARWSVEVEDSAGRSLGQTEAGALARLVLQAAIDFRPLNVQALLAHPSARLGRTRDKRDSTARALELGVFRAAPLVTLESLDAAFAAAREAADDPHAHPAVRSIGAAGRAEAERLACDCAAALGALRAPASAPLGNWFIAHRAALSAVLAAPSDDCEPPHGLIALDGLLDEWGLAAGDGFTCTLADYARLLEEALAGVRAPPWPGGHPRLVVLGLLEARLLAFDRVLIAGLDEKVWPPAVNTDAFLNRPMRASLGLSPPERRIGQTAHDFTAALGAREVILSRAKKRGGEPTVASRFLQRLGAAAGLGAIEEAERRGQKYLAWGRALDRPAKVAPVKRPAPTPPVEKRPRSLSVTRVETLRRDPYAIYAERILRLAPLGEVDQALGPSEAGEAWHGALEDFARAFPEGLLPPAARETLRRFARDRFAELLRDRAFSGLNWPNIEKAIDFVVRFENETRGETEHIFVERRGEVVFPLSDGKPFKLTARADRIDRLAAGGARLIDYKSGAPPGKTEVTIGLAPQLTLEAAILAQGGFADIGALIPKQALYLKLGGADGGEARDAAEKGEDVAALSARHFADLKILLEQFIDPATPYLSRPMPKFLSRFADYDHLARVKEWSAAGGAGETPAGHS